MQNPMRKLIGYVEVISGQIVVVDPNHMDKWKRDPHYYEVFRKSNNGGGECFGVGDGQINVAVCCETYTSNKTKEIPVYAHYDPKGHVYKLEIRIGPMTGEKEEED